MVLHARGRDGVAEQLGRRRRQVLPRDRGHAGISEDLALCSTARWRNDGVASEGHSGGCAQLFVSHVRRHPSLRVCCVPVVRSQRPKNGPARS